MVVQNCLLHSQEVKKEGKGPGHHPSLLGHDPRDLSSSHRVPPSSIEGLGPNLQHRVFGEPFQTIAAYRIIKKIELKLKIHGLYHYLPSHGSVLEALYLSGLQSFCLRNESSFQPSRVWGLSDLCSFSPTVFLRTVPTASQAPGTPGNAKTPGSLSRVCGEGGYLWLTHSLMHLHKHFFFFSKNTLFLPF